ncbi:MAG: C_GCAxxG_C_C family protein, partial [Deltaproteobacteria bacterium]|nr:C_GCAxxG_C_C family protein [Deltaproteobacteria bacterium]
MVDLEALKARVEELRKLDWDRAGIEARLQALSPFPGFGMTGWICGGVTGGLMALGFFFGSNDATDYGATGRTMTAARKFILRFEQAFGTILCPKIQEEVIFDRYMDPRAS